MKKIIATLLLISAVAGTSMAQSYVPAPENLQNRKEFSEARFGIFIHWGVYSMMADGEWVMHMKKLPYEEYKHLPGGFYPSKFNADEWVKLFKEAGAKYITITSRHHDGFSMFDSKVTDYDIMDATPFKRDVLKELSEACAKEGIKLNFYYSHLDWGRNDYYPLGGTGHDAGRPEGGDWNSYLKFMNAQLTELLTNYGPIGCIWFDGMWDKKGECRDDIEKIWKLKDQYKLIHSIQPGCMVGNNHHLPVFEGEDFQMFEQDLPGQNTTGFSDEAKVSEDLPLETCMTMNGNWGYNCTDHGYKSFDELIKYLVHAASLNANYLLNIGPRPDGTIPDEAVERLKAIGQWLSKYGETVYATHGGCIPEQGWGVTTQKDNKLYVHVFNHSNSIFVPFKGNKLVSAVAFDDGAKVPFSQVGEGIVLTIPEAKEGTVDQIFTLTFKNTL